MIIKRVGILSILPENEKTYYDYIIGFLDSIDIECSLLINKSEGKVSFRVTPSRPQLLPYLLQGIKDIHTKFNIHVEFSESIRTSGSIFFFIPS